MAFEKPKPTTPQTRPLSTPLTAPAHWVAWIIGRKVIETRRIVARSWFEARALGRARLPLKVGEDVDARLGSALTDSPMLERASELTGGTGYLTKLIQTAAKRQDGVVIKDSGAPNRPAQPRTNGKAKKR